MSLDDYDAHGRLKPKRPQENINPKSVQDVNDKNKTTTTKTVKTNDNNEGN